MKKLALDNGRIVYVSDDGSIYNEKHMVLKQQIDRIGYASISIRRKRYLVHRLVAMAFICSLDNGKQVHHINGNKEDNRVENLEVLTTEEHQHLHKQIYPTTKICEICGKEFTPNPTKRKSAKTCSYQCWLQITKTGAEKRKRSVAQIDMNGNIVKVWNSARDIQNETGFFESNINKCCNGVIKSYKGYIWSYAKERGTT